MKTVTAVCLLLCAPIFAKAKSQDVPSGTACARSFTVVTQDTLNNIKQGLSTNNVKWFQKKLAKKYPGVCYANPAPSVPIVFYITITPDTYHGTRIVRGTESNPVSGTITDDNGDTSQVSGTVETTSTTAVPYSFEYGIFTLSVKRRRNDGKFDVLPHSSQRRAGMGHTMLFHCVSSLAG